jgi:cation:H+ antiporter
MLLATIEFTTVLIFIVGLAMVCYGADVFVAGASRIAVLMKISPMLVAVTIVAFASSAPELFVSLQASTNATAAGKATADQVLGNIIGSNICNIALAIGICTLLHPIKINQKFFSKEIIFFVLSTLMLLFFVNEDHVLQRREGVILFCSLFAFFFYCIREVRKRPESVEGLDEDYLQVKEDNGKTPYIQPIFKLALGLGLLVLGSDLMVKKGEIIGQVVGFTDSQIGVFIFALGTSIPELAISVTAALRKEDDIAVGNIVGSNIFNIFCVGGLVSSIRPIGVSALMVDNHLMVMMFVSLSLLFFIRLGKPMGKIHGLYMLAIYAIYLYMAVFEWTGTSPIIKP